MEFGINSEKWHLWQLWATHNYTNVAQGNPNLAQTKTRVFFSAKGCNRTRFTPARSSTWAICGVYCDGLNHSYIYKLFTLIWQVIKRIVCYICKVHLVAVSVGQRSALQSATLRALSFLRTFLVSSSPSARLNWLKQ